jgi:hypothetical protein
MNVFDVRRKTGSRACPGRRSPGNNSSRDGACAGEPETRCPAAVAMFRQDSSRNGKRSMYDRHPRIGARRRLNSSTYPRGAVGRQDRPLTKGHQAACSGERAPKNKFVRLRSDEVRSLPRRLLVFEFLNPLFDRLLIEAPVRAHFKGRNSTIF